MGDAKKNFNNAKFAELKARTKNTGRIGYQSDAKLTADLH